MRLIDADALLKQLLEAKDHEIIKAVIGLVQTQPTAYDVEEVVAELEDLRQFIFDDMIVGYCQSTITKAIDIVRKGGVG